MHCSRVATIQVLPSTLLWQRSRQVLALSAKKIEQYVASMLLYEAVTEQDEKIVENLLTQYKADPTVRQHLVSQLSPGHWRFQKAAFML